MWTVPVEPDVLDLRDYLAVLRRRRWTIAAVTLVTLAAALLVTSVQTPIYEATAELAVEPVRRTEDTSLQELILGESVVETERRVVTSRPVSQRVIDRVGLDVAPTDLLESVSVEAIRNTRALEVTVTDPDPATAADVANAFAEEYLEYRREQAVGELLAAQATLDERAAEIRDRVTELDRRIAAADDEDTVSLQAEREGLLGELAQLIARTGEIGTAADAVRGGGVILQPAVVPEQPVSPKPLRTGVLALVLGGMLGVGLAFLRDFLDDAIRDEDDLKRASHGQPVLGRIPTGKDADESLTLLTEPDSSQSESYRMLGTNVRFLTAANRHEGPGRFGTSVVVTSAHEAEGKTITAANLAVAASLAGLRVVLVDGDLRRYRLARRFGLGNPAGLSDVLATGDAVEPYLVDVGLEHLRLLPAGTPPPNAAELLSSQAFRRLRERLETHADLVIIDAPPALVVSDTLELASQADHTIFVVRAGVSTRRAVAAAIERLASVGVTLSGTVLNGVSPTSAYGYYDYYAAPEADGSRRGRGRKRPPQEPGVLLANHGTATRDDGWSPAEHPTPSQWQSPEDDQLFRNS